MVGTIFALDDMINWGIKINIPRITRTHIPVSPVNRIDINSGTDLNCSFNSAYIGHYTTASGLSKVSESEAKVAFANYYPQGILDRSFLRKKNYFEHKLIGTKGWDWFADYFRVGYVPKEMYWDWLETAIHPDKYRKALCMWPVANITLSDYYPLGGADPEVYAYMGIPKQDGAYKVAAPINDDRTQYAGYVSKYFDVVSKFCLDEALKAALMSAQSDEDSVYRYAKAVYQNINLFLQALPETGTNITVTDQKSGKRMMKIYCSLPSRLSSEEEFAAVVESVKDLPPQQQKDTAYSLLELEPVQYGGIYSVNKSASLTIPVTVNSQTLYMSVYGAIRYFTNVAAYVLMRQNEKLWARYEQLNNGRPLIPEDVLYDPSRNIFLNIDWEKVKETSKAIYKEEGKSTASRAFIPQLITRSGGPSAFDMLRSVETMKTHTRELRFEDVAKAPGGAAKKSGVGTFLAIAAAGAGFIYAKKEGYI